MRRTARQESQDPTLTPGQSAPTVLVAPCRACGGKRQPSDHRYGRLCCLDCTSRRQVKRLLGKQSLERTLTTAWARDLLQGCAAFLEPLDMSWNARRQLLLRARLIFKAAEAIYAERELVDPAWIHNEVGRLSPASRGTRFATGLLHAFLAEQGFPAPTHDRDREKLTRVLLGVADLPAGYQRAVEVFLNEGIAQREWQIRQQARHIRSIRTVETEWQLLARIVRWLASHYPQVVGWDMVQEEHVQVYLLTLSPAQRGITRRKLLYFFRAARRRRTIAHVPLTAFPSRAETDRPLQALDYKSQRALARHIRLEGALQPTEALLTVLCFYHALTMSEILRLRLVDVVLDSEQALLRIGGRPPVYLTADDLVLLQLHLQRRAKMPFARTRTYLFIPGHRAFVDRAVRSPAIRIWVRAFSGYLPSQLRTTCLVAAAAQYGPQYLVDAFGVSLTHASRFGRLSDPLVEAVLGEQLDTYEKMAQWGRIE